MKITHLVAIFSLVLFAAPVGADYFFQEVTEGFTTIGGTSVACSDDGMVVVAWSMPPVGVFTRTIHLDMVETPVFHGPGDMPSLCSINGYFFLAYAHEDSLIIKEGDGLEWIPWATHHFTTPSGEDVLFPRVTPMGIPIAMLVWEERGEGIWKSTYQSQWFDPVYVAPPSSFTMSAPQVELSVDMTYRVYQMNEMNTCIDYFEGSIDGGAFTPYDIFPGLGYFGSMYDVCKSPMEVHAILSMGPQPTCPCNNVVFSEETEPHVWSEPIPLTVPVDAYDFPQFPCVAADEDGGLHAYWFQSASNEWLEETHRGLYYFTRGEDLVWVDQSDIFGAEVGVWCSMDLGPYGKPVFVYAKGDYPDRQVWLGRDELLTGAPEAPALLLALSATPNPFNPKTTLSFTLPEAGRAELAIFDLQGRRVLTMLDEHRDAGEVVVEWNAEGLASGVYLAQATVPRYSEVTKLILLK
ncbi:T9SS type A sorting domain-containing protein [bacterium]|nr:T9SS type A sorting domain-containing protein [bacterium]